MHCQLFFSLFSVFATFKKYNKVTGPATSEILGIGVLQQFGTTWQVPNFFLQKSLPPIMYELYKVQIHYTVQ